MPHSLTVAELARHAGARVIGDGGVAIERAASLAAAGVGDISFVEAEKHFEAASRSQASCLIVPPGAPISTACRLEAARPRLAFTLIAGLLHPPKQRSPAIHRTAAVAESAAIADGVFIGPHVTIGEGARIGQGTRLEAGCVVGDHVSIGCDCVLHPHVVLYDGVSIDDRVILHAGVCIGADGFGYVHDGARHQKFPHLGTVVIESDVELGAYTCVDRAAFGRTRIGRGSKLDNLVHVGHNCDIGENVVIAAQTGIMGSVTIEADAIISGQVGIGDHSLVQTGAVIGGKAGVPSRKIVRPGGWWGIPARPWDSYKRMHAHLRRLPAMGEDIRDLRRRLSRLEEDLKNDDH